MDLQTLNCKAFFLDKIISCMKTARNQHCYCRCHFHGEVEGYACGNGAASVPVEVVEGLLVCQLLLFSLFSTLLSVQRWEWMERVKSKI